MAKQRQGKLIGCGFLVLLSVSCVANGPGAASGTGGGSTTGTGGTGGAGTGGAAGTPTDAGSDAAETGGAGGASTTTGWGGCAETPTRLRTSGTILELPFDLFLEDQPFVYGEPNALAAGGSLIPLNVRFYVSEVALLRAGAEPVPVDIVTATGMPQPYDLHMFNAEDVASRTVRVLAPAGTYTGITFLLGLNPACNQGNPGNRLPPLTDTSQLTWPHLPGIGYLFLRYEARLDPTTGADASASDDGGAGATGIPYPLVIHMGGDPRVPSAPVIRLDASLSVPTTGSVSKTVRLIMDQVFKGATTEVDLTGFIGLPGVEVIAGERLRRNAPGLQLFVFAP